MNLIQFQGALELGLIYGLVAIGVYLSFRVLQFPDLTVDGSFPLGAAVCAASITHGAHPLVALVLATVAGAFAGWITAWLSTQLKMLNLLAGILTMSALYSINLRVMGNKPNLSLLGEPTLFNWVGKWLPESIPSVLVVLLIVIAVVGLSMIGFLGTRKGLAVRAVGCNARMARAQGVNDAQGIRLGLALANGCVSLSGALFSQVFGFADVTLGVGTIIIGLASVILGEAIFPTRTVIQGVIACAGGAIVYRLLIALSLSMGDVGLQASDLNLLTAILVVVAMAFPKINARAVNAKAVKTRALKAESALMPQTNSSSGV